MAAPLYTEKDDSNYRRHLLQLCVTKVSARQLLLTFLLVGLVMPACQTAPPLYPTLLPPATPLPPQPPVGSSSGSPATPRPAAQPPTPVPWVPPPVPRPFPTPISLTDMRWTAVAYREYFPMDLYGSHSVGIGGRVLGRNAGILLVNVENGEKRRITEDGHGLEEVAISENHIAWSDRSRQIVVPGSTAEKRRGRLAVDIFVMNLLTGEQRRLTDVPARRRNLSMDGNILVWEDNRNEIGEHRSHYDIYAYDIDAGEEIAVEIAPGAQRYPAVSGDRVVWLDEGGDSSRIMLHDFAREETKVVDTSTEPELRPDIHDDYIVWQGSDDKGDRVIYLHNLKDDTRDTISSPSLGRIDSPLVSDRHAVWTVKWDCDTRSNIMPDDIGVYVYDLEDGDVRQISNYVEPDIWIDGGTLLVHEACQMSGRVYTVFLE